MWHLWPPRPFSCVCACQLNTMPSTRILRIRSDLLPLDSFPCLTLLKREIVSRLSACISLHVLVFNVELGGGGGGAAPSSFPKVQTLPQCSGNRWQQHFFIFFQFSPRQKITVWQGIPGVSVTGLGPRGCSETELCCRHETQRWDFCIKQKWKVGFNRRRWCLRSLWLTAALYLLAAAVALLITWKIPINSFDVQEKARNLLGEFVSTHYISWLLSFAWIGWGLTRVPPLPFGSFFLDSNYIDRIKATFKGGEDKRALPHRHGVNGCFTLPPSVSVKTSAGPKCGLPRVCPPDRFAVRLTSGAADVVGPRICFQGQTCVTGSTRNLRELRLAPKKPPPKPN